MTQYVVSPFYPISDRVDESHRAGWARYAAQELGATLLTTQHMGLVGNLKRGDELVCYHGMEFKGQLNLQSGLTPEILDRVRRLCDAAKKGVKIFSLDVPMPNYGELLFQRGLDDMWAERLTKLCHKAGKILTPNLRPRHLVIGDSHALAMYRPGSCIVRNDSLTLHGALRREGGLLTDTHGIFEFEWGGVWNDVEGITAYYGNIDVRHHLHRQPDPKQAIKELVAAYGQSLLALKLRYDKPVEVVLPLPIEDESRPIPKSGWYKGSPFAGSWHERHQLRLELRDQLKRMCKKHGFVPYEHPRHFVDRQGKLTFEVMEKPRSVHIRPSEYRLAQEGQTWQTS